MCVCMYGTYIISVRDLMQMRIYSGRVIIIKNYIQNVLSQIPKV